MSCVTDVYMSSGEVCDGYVTSIHRMPSLYVIQQCVCLLITDTTTDNGSLYIMYTDGEGRRSSSNSSH